MSGKKNIRIPLTSNNKLVTVELNNSFDLLEILSLKFTQSDIYQSGLCSDYGVVVGRVSANNGLGIPNAKVSIFVPLNDNDEIDPIISSLYPYKSISDKDENGYRYNLLPKRKQHGGHNPTGTFFGQEDILTGEEYLEVFEKYYSYTSKTNESGDFMIWGVPVGTHTIHIDIDLSDIGCFSLRPYDFIRKGIGADKFERAYSFKSSSDIDGLPQIVKFEKTIEVYPFIGNEELCEIGISRVDFDLTEADIKIEPVSLILVSTITDDDSKGIKKNGEIISKSGYKCNLQTKEGTIESVRFTGGKVYGSDGELYPELEYFTITETIDQNGVAMVVLPMNIDYVYTNEFGEQEITLDKNKGIPTKCISRFRFGLNNNDGKKVTAKYLVPNIREFNSNIYGKNKDYSRNGGEYDELMVTSYMFSDVFEDYLKVPESYNINFQNTIDDKIKLYKKNLILNYDDELKEIVPKDYFYKFTYGKVYTISSFQGSHYQGSQISNFQQTLTGIKRKDNFLGIKEIRPNEEEDCNSSTNYFPVNYSFRNFTKMSLVISDIVLLLEYIFFIATTWIYEHIGLFFIKISETLGTIGTSTLIGEIKPLITAADDFSQLAFKIQEFGQTILPLTTYPNCVECTYDSDNIGFNNIVDINEICKSGEIKTSIVTYIGNLDDNVNGVYLVYNNGWLNTSEMTGSTYLSELFPNNSAKDNCAMSITEGDLVHLQDYYLNESVSKRFISDVYLDYNNEWSNYQISFGKTNYNLFSKRFKYVNISNNNINYYSKITLEQDEENGPYRARYGYSDQTTPDKIIINVGTEYETMTFTINEGESISNEEYIVNSRVPTVISAYPESQLLAIQFTLDEWEKLVNNLIIVDEPDAVYSYIMLYDTENRYSNTENNNNIGSIKIEEDCKKYDKFYNEELNLSSYIWSYNNAKYDEYGIDYPKSYNLPLTHDTTHIFFNDNNKKWTRNLSFNTRPLYDGSLYRQSLSSPGNEYTIIASVGKNSYPLPDYCITSNNIKFKYHSYQRKTKSGLTEIRDGIFTIVPNIISPGNNQNVINEWYKRKRISLFFCGGIVNYSFIDNWLNGLLYFFKFNKKISWDNEEVYDLNQRSSKFPRDLIFFNVLDNNFYYRSTPFNPVSKTFIGQKDELSNYEILHPTTFYDVGIRDEFYYEICSNPSLDPTCSVIRDLSTTSYQDPGNIIEYGLSYVMDISNGSAKIDDFFKNKDFNNRLSILNGDIIQLFSINSESGIEAFDLDSSQYFMYNNDILDPEDSNNHNYFTRNGESYGPLPIDFKMNENGRFIRLCLNNRLGDYSQDVPFYLWDKKGEGFGAYLSEKNKQNWDRSKITNMRLQRIFSKNDINDSSTNYLMTDGEEEYLLRPMTINHNTLSFNGNFIDSIDRFDNISLDTPPLNEIGNGNATGRTESELWLKVTSGTTKDPLRGLIYVVVNQTWILQSVEYIKDQNEIFIFQTVQNYSGTKQVLSTPFMFYFGLRPQNTSLDLLIKYYGPKGYFKNTD